MLSELCDAHFRNPVTLAQNISFLWWINLKKQQHHPQVREIISGLGYHFKKIWIPKDIKESTQDQDQGHGYTKLLLAGHKTTASALLHGQIY